MHDLKELTTYMVGLCLALTVSSEELRKLMFNLGRHVFLVTLIFAADFLHVCHKSDPNLNQCIRSSVETLRPLLVSGIPQYEIPSLEPINLGDLLVAGQAGKTGQGLTITAKDVKAFGASNWILKNLK